MESNHRFVSYRVVTGAVGASGVDRSGREGNGEKSGEAELHVCGNVVSLGGRCERKRCDDDE